MLKSQSLTTVIMSKLSGYMMVTEASVDTRYRSTPSASRSLLLQLAELLRRKQQAFKLFILNLVSVSRKNARASGPSIFRIVDEIEVSENSAE